LAENPDHQLVMPTVGADIAFGLVEESVTSPNTPASRRSFGSSEFAMQRRPIYALSGVKTAGGDRRCDRASVEVLLLDEPTARSDSQRLVAQVRRLVKPGSNCPLGDIA